MRANRRLQRTGRRGTLHSGPGIAVFARMWPFFLR